MCLSESWLTMICQLMKDTNDLGIVNRNWIKPRGIGLPPRCGYGWPPMSKNALMKWRWKRDLGSTNFRNVIIIIFATVYSWLFYIRKWSIGFSANLKVWALIGALNIRNSCLRIYLCFIPQSLTSLSKKRECYKKILGRRAEFQSLALNDKDPSSAVSLCGCAGRRSVVGDCRSWTNLEYYITHLHAQGEICQKELYCKDPWKSAKVATFFLQN